jgi:hypothetical protein
MGHYECAGSTAEQSDQLGPEALGRSVAEPAAGSARGLADPPAERWRLGTQKHVHLTLAVAQVTDHDDSVPLAGLRALTKLNIRDTNVADLRPVATLPVIRDAEKLDLTGTRVASLEAVAELPKLRDLRLTGTPVPDAAVDELRQARPELDILR